MIYFIYFYSFIYLFAQLKYSFIQVSTIYEIVDLDIISYSIYNSKHFI